MVLIYLTNIGCLLFARHCSRLCRYINFLKKTKIPVLWELMFLYDETKNKVYSAGW